MIRAAATDTTCVPLLPPALYLTVVLRFTSAGSRPRSSEQFRMRKFDCTQPSRPAGTATEEHDRALRAVVNNAHVVVQHLHVFGEHDPPRAPRLARAPEAAAAYTS